MEWKGTSLLGDDRSIRGGGGGVWSKPISRCDVLSIRMLISRRITTYLRARGYADVDVYRWTR